MPDTLGWWNFVRYSEVSVRGGFTVHIILLQWLRQGSSPPPVGRLFENLCLHFNSYNISQYTVFIIYNVPTLQDDPFNVWNSLFQKTFLKYFFCKIYINYFNSLQIHTILEKKWYYLLFLIIFFKLFTFWMTQ